MISQKTPSSPIPKSFADAPVPLDAEHAVPMIAPNPSPIDANGFDPNDYEWVPLPKIQRSDGWSPKKQRAFIETLADTGSITTASTTVGMSRTACYKLRRSPGGENFAAAWDAAILQARKQAIDIALDRIVHGVDEPVIDKEGNFIYMKSKFSDRLLLALVNMQEGSGRGLSGRPDTGRSQINETNLADAIDRLEPIVPAQPHKLMHPDSLNAMLAAAQADEHAEIQYLKDADAFQQAKHAAAKKDKMAQNKRI